MDNVTLNKEAIEAKIKHLEAQLNGNLFHNMPIRQSISEARKQLRTLEGHNLPPRPDDSDFECVGCGS